MTPEEYYQSVAVLYGEMRGQPDNALINVGSSLLNRYDNFDKYWGWRGTYSDMLREEYYAIRDSESGKNTGYYDALNYFINKKPMPSEAEENDLKRAMQIMKGLSSGSIQRTDAEYFLTPKEVKRIESKGKKIMDMSLLEKIGEFEDRDGNIFWTYRYKR